MSVARQNLTLTEREQRAAIQASYTAAMGYFERWQLAQQAATTLFDNAKLTQKAYQRKRRCSNDSSIKPSDGVGNEAMTIKISEILAATGLTL